MQCSKCGNLIKLGSESNIYFPWRHQDLIGAIVSSFTAIRQVPSEAAPSEDDRAAV